jgi:hypothetical protein
VAMPAPRGPQTVEQLLASLIPTERAIHDTATPADALTRLGETEQLDAGTLASHPAWLGAVLTAMPPDLRVTVVADVTADSELSAIPGPTATAIPPWQIVPARPPSELLDDYHAAQQATGVPWDVLAAIHLVESRMGRIRGPSSAGAEGPMQFLPTTWTSFGNGGDIWSDRDAIFAAARFLRHYGAPADLSAAVLRYNPSIHYVRAVLAYASVMSADERAFFAYYGWKVYVATTAGVFVLPEGYGGN